MTEIRRRRAAVIGGGITGISAALFLQRDGHDVTVFERDEIGTGTSMGNSGVISIAGCIPTSVPGIVGRVPKMLMDPYGPLSIRWGYLPNLLPWLNEQFADSAKRAKWIDALLKIAAVLVAAIVAEYLAGRLLARPRDTLEVRIADAWGIRALTLVARMLLELVPIAAFAITAEFALSILDAREITVSAARAIVAANVTVRGILVIARMVLAPRVEQLRLLALDSESANYAYIWIRRFANVGLYGAFIIEAVVILGLPVAGSAVLQKLLALVLLGMAVALILQLREPVCARIAGDSGARGASLRARFADIWHVVAILYVIALFCVWLLDISGGFVLVARATAVTLLAGIVARLVDIGANRLLHRLFSLRPETLDRYPGLEARAGRYLPVVYGIARAVVWFVATIVAAEAWGVSAFEWLGSETGGAFLGTIAQILVIAVLSVTILELTGSAIERYMRRSQDNGHTSARMMTLLPLLRNVLRVTIGVIATLIVLSEIGIDIGPLLAGAGVAGLAVGFGAQKLVQDIINGMFLIIEDTVAVGDVVRVAGHTGLCEGLTIRTIRLRDLSGTVHTVPFNEVSTIENLTKDFSFAVMDVGVAYREDTDAVIDILHEVADDLRADTKYNQVILEPLEVLGVDEFADSAVVIKVRIKTLPVKQWMVKREFNRRMKKAFDANRIEIPFPHTTLYFGEDRQGAAPPAHVVLAERFRQDASTGASGDASAPTASDAPDTRLPGTDMPE